MNYIYSYNNSVSHVSLYLNYRFTPREILRPYTRRWALKSFRKSTGEPTGSCKTISVKTTLMIPIETSNMLKKPNDFQTG